MRGFGDADPSFPFDDDDVIDFVVGDAREEVAAAIRRRVAGGGDPELAARIECLKYALGEAFGADGSDPPPPGGGPGGVAAAVRAVMDEATWEAANRAGERLDGLTAAVGQKFHATSAFLFLYDEANGTLFARFTYRTNCRDLVLQVDDPRGIVAHVARTRRGYCCPDTRAEAHYLDAVRGTLSELTVPVLAPDGRLLGVFNLESHRVGAFAPAQTDELLAAMPDLVPHLLVLEALDVCPYHPEVHGGDLTGLLTRVCGRVARAADRDPRSDVTTCTLWRADWCKRELYVEATYGYDDEYIADLTLPLAPPGAAGAGAANSFTGRVASSPPGRVWDTTPDGAPDFRNPAKAKDLNLRRIVSAPVYLPGSSREPGGAFGALSVYYFGEGPPDVGPAREALPALAGYLGALIAAYEVQRERWVAARLRQELALRTMSSDARFDVLRRVLVEAFGAEMCSVLARPAGRRSLAFVASTGLEPSRRAGDAAGAAYDLDDPRSYTAFLGRHCGAAVRKNDVTDADEPGLPAGFPPRPLNKVREAFALSEADRRRFLGVGVDVGGDEPDGADADVLGVIRFNRPTHSRPFTRSDERLLTFVAGLDLCKQVFLDRRATEKPPAAAAAAWAEAPEWDDGPQPFPPPRPPLLVEAVARLIGPVPVLDDPKKLAAELLQSLAVIFRDYRVRQAGIVVHHGGAGAAAFRWHGYHSPERKGPPDDGAFTPAVGPAGGAEWRTLFRGRKVLTFRPPEGAAGRGGGPRSEVWVPLRTWNGAHALEAVLALDFHERVPWGGAPLEILFNATRRLSAILSRADRAPSIRPESFRLDPGTALLDRFLEFPIGSEAIRAGWAEITLTGGASARRAADRYPGRAAPAPAPADGRGDDPSLRGKAEAFGITYRDAEGGCTIPLALGPFDVGALRCGFEGDSERDRRDEFIRSVPGLWSRLTIGMQPFYDVSFEPTARADGVTLWDERIRVHVNRPPDPGTHPRRPSLVY